MYYDVGWNRTQKLILLNKWLHICYIGNNNSLASSLFVRVSITILCIISYFILTYIHNSILAYFNINLILRIILIFKRQIWFAQQNSQGQHTSNIIIIKDYFYKVIWNCPKMFYSFFDLSPNFQIITKLNHLSFIIQNR